MDNKESSASSRYFYFDTMRTVAIYWVLMAHVREPWNPSLKKESDFRGLHIWNSLTWHMFTSAGVPLFFMISGALLFSKTESLWNLYTRRIWRMFLHFVVWRALTIAVDRDWLHDEPKTEQEAHSVNHL